MKIMIATDAWRPQINGVVRSYERLREQLTKKGIETCFLTPDQFRNFPCPTYPEIRLAWLRQRDVAGFVEQHQPDHIHIATEGPIGLRARSWCVKNSEPYTTSYHTRFPEYVAARFAVPVGWSYAFQRWFHNAGAGLMVATSSLEQTLRERDFKHIQRWSRGVDIKLFRPREDVRLFGDGPVYLYVGRVAVEKNLPAFLKLELPGKKVVVGDGPAMKQLQREFPDVEFAGVREGEALAEAYASADVFVFPSLTDTFGIVLLEAMASGVPVAAYPVTGPVDVITDGVDGVLRDDLQRAVLEALELDPAQCRNSALNFSWESSAQMFMDNVAAAHPELELKLDGQAAAFPVASAVAGE